MVAAPPLGVLRCASSDCECRVTGQAPAHCCPECCETGGLSHGEACLQMPPVGKPHRLQQLQQKQQKQQQCLWQRADAGPEHSYGSRFHGLLTAKGPLRLGVFPAAWNALYGAGAWERERPVRAVHKACLPPYVSGVEVIDSWVYAVEDMIGPSEALCGAAHVDKLDIQVLSWYVRRIMDTEFCAVVADRTVTTSYARSTDVCRCCLVCSETPAKKLAEAGGAVRSIQNKIRVDIVDSGVCPTAAASFTSEG
jgi:hypothetical protein